MRRDQAGMLLEPGYLSLESGTTRLEDGQLHVASRTTMPGCKGHRHCTEEMGYLAEFLPRLYERETR